LFRFKKLEVFWPRTRRNEANVILSRERAFPGNPVISANIRIGVTAAKGLLFRIKWVKRHARRVGVSFHIYSAVEFIFRTDFNHAWLNGKGISYASQTPIAPIVHLKLNAGKEFPSAIIRFHVISARQV
jgi:hypothetical protein